MITLIAIPLSLVAALVFLDLLRKRRSTSMLLAGLMVAVGVVVDDAIIDVENVTRRLRRASREGRREARWRRVILEGSLEVRSSITYATLIIARRRRPRCSC